MKFEKKHVIIALVVAVALWFLWKKGFFSKLTAKANAGGTPTDGGSSGIDLDYILSHVNYTGTERAAIRSLAKKAEENTDTRQSLQAKAYTNGVSFDQQVALDAIWMLYHVKVNGVWSEDWTDYRGKELNSKVRNL